MQGFLNLNKPFGWTSHDCVAKVRKLLRLKRVGHAGTLDPAATGVLPIALGKATRLLQYLPGDKAYNATIRFGIQTTTDDLQGEVIASCACPELKLEDIKDLLPQFLGKVNQIPPSYSAIQVDGKRLYDLARQGIAVEAPVRTVEIFSIEVLDWRPGEFAELDVAIACGAGTYIRSIARDLGAALDVGGTLAALQRTVSSGFNLANSISIEALEAQLQTFQPMSPDAPLQYLSSISLLEEDAKKWRQGQRIAQQINESSQYLRVYTDGLFIGISEFKDDLLVPAMVFEPVN
ncbi:tRNA pseudouridine synthase B [Dulcicalothrix desertica PCC 7102]|uniref:tRNA pseudouridine synthase B n=1 Tax=Dulcicalothrix desertica PCC 7102 TaxID=232991 RepID=A0A3S1CVW2_9CYAN|nr:tRNA pseudouridine(55) synthase TruB [Dulcicalothrix desertica]RUT10263.1 tRNA pseudouridine synthase B [Dulcicalothrix desertica PCC 7102]TWH40762.1 tRNA pseudouridine55 synthase [Dulcicalothrix desertica PCC 7102]